MMTRERVAVIGAGKMGLPIACHVAGRGKRVVACDTNAALVESIRRGDCPFDEPGLAELLGRVRRESRLDATTDTDRAVAEADVVIVLVPVLLTPDKHADLAILHDVTRVIGANVRRGALVVYETTLPVGTTRSLVPMLEAGGLKAGRDFHLAFSPERVKSRLVLEKLGQTPKVVGGLTPECARAAEEFYAEALGAPVRNVATLEAAEFTKLADMIYRDTNIALANELARYADATGVDFATAREAANTSGEAQILLPGIGVGGHCTPVYPWFAIHDADARGMKLDLAAQGRATNDAQAAWMLDRLERAWAPLSGKRAAILGLGFRPGVKEHTCSPAFLVGDELQRRGARVELHDSLYTADEIRAHGFEPAASFAGADVLVLCTAHFEYTALNFNELARGGLKAVVDGRNAWDPHAVRRAGIVYVGVGRGV